MGNFTYLDDVRQNAGNFTYLDEIPAAPEGGLVAAAKQAIGATIKGAGQAAADYIPWVSADNQIKSYGQSVIDANPTAIQSFGDIADSPWMATKEAVGNAAGSMATMVGGAAGARAIGTGLSAMAPFAGPYAPAVGAAGRLVSTVGAAAMPIISAALPSYAGIRDDQIKASPANEDDARSKAIAALGAMTVGAIETHFGPQEWALTAMRKGGLEELARRFGTDKSFLGAIGKGVAHGAAIEGAEELVQNPIEQLAGYKDPTTMASIKETMFGGAMGAIGGGTLGGGMAGLARARVRGQEETAGNPIGNGAQTTSPGIYTATTPEDSREPNPIASTPYSGTPTKSSGPLGKAVDTGIASGAISQYVPEIPPIPQETTPNALNNGTQTEITEPATAGRPAQPATVSDSSGEVVAASANHLPVPEQAITSHPRAPFVAPQFTAPPHPTSIAGALTQTSAPLSLGEYGRRKQAPEVSGQSPAVPLPSPASSGNPAPEQTPKQESKTPQSVDEIANAVQESIAKTAISHAIKRADASQRKGFDTPAEAAEKKAKAESFWKSHRPGEHVRKIAQAIADKNPEPLLPILVNAYSTNQGTARAFEKMTGASLKGNAAAREQALFDWAGWGHEKVDEYRKRQEEARAAAKNASDEKKRRENDIANTNYLKGRQYKMQDGSIISAADLIDQMIASGHTSLEEYKAGAIKKWDLMNPGTNRGITLRDKYEADYAAARLSDREVSKLLQKQQQQPASAKKTFVFPPLTTPEQPTTTRALEQKSVQMPLPKHATVASNTELTSNSPVDKPFDSDVDDGKKAKAIAEPSTANTQAAEPSSNPEEFPAKSAKLNYDEASTPKEAPDDSADQRGSPSLDQPMAEGQRPDNPIRGAVTPRSRPRRPDDRGVRGAGRRSDVSTDESKPLGDGGRSAAVSDGTDGAVAGGVRRVSADFRPGLGALTREGSWFDAAKRNIDLIELAIKIDKEGRNATTEEQARLAKYVGFGASEIRNALFPVPGSYAKRLEPNRLIWPNLVYDARWKPLAERIEALPVEWQQSILQSTQYAHYTSEGIIRSIWSAIQRLGFTGGNIFEPGTGIGSFSMLMPDGIHETSRFTGVEFDAPTALIARLLSPDQQIQHDDFIKRKFPKNYFDVNVGNPPFSQTKILGDAEYAKHGFMLHDFFFAKGIDLVRPGGLQVFVTSKGTMDKKNDRARKYLSDRADLIGAIRLPSTAFEGNAGTSVVTDVIFLRKRDPGEAPGGMAWGAIKTVETKDGPVEVNEYFADHPEMILGQQRISGNIDDLGRRVNSNGYGGEKYTVVSYDSTPAELDAKFAEAVERLPENVYSPLRQSDEAVKTETRKVDFDPSVKREGVIYLDKDGAILRVSSGVGVPLDEKVKLSNKDRAWLKGYVGIRDLVQSARLAQVTDGDWKAALSALNKAYDAFRTEHGPILDFRTQVRKSTDEDGNIIEIESRIFKNKRLYREDYDSALLTSLEKISESGEIVKAPFLLGRTIGKPVVVEVNGIGDALAVSLDSIGSLNLADVGRRIGLSMEDTIEALGNQIYKTPSGKWQLADEYLSGDVVTKLEEAEHLARANPEYWRNVEALKEVQPERLGPSQISVKLGASWVPVEYVDEFAKEIGAGHVTFDIKTETWQVEGGNLRTERKAGAEYGTAKRSASELLESSLNSRQIKVTTVVDKKTVTDVEATTAANEMAKKIKDKFKSWVWTDSNRALELVEVYNKRFNNIAPRKFDGSHLTLPGVSLRFKLHPHQLRSIWRQIQTGNTYLAHAVGAGKTIEMIAGAMEQKRLGLIKKPMFVVPNHMLEQFSNEFMDLYPLANIMVADDENFSAERRKAFVASATLNNPDAIIITHSAFKRIGVTEASVAPIRSEIVTDLEIELESLAKDQGTRVRRSQLEQQIEAVNQRFDAILGASGKDSTIKFEDIGVDFIYADEAHAFRKLDFHTAQQIKGIDPNGSQAAMDMYVKTRILERARPGRSFVFASGTPVTNTMGELFTIMRFFAPQEMEISGISSFDSWARQFGEVAPALEPNAAGKYELIERFSKFDNVPELMSRVRQFMDVLTSESLGALVKRPNLAGGKPNLVIVEPTKALEEYMKGELSQRIEASKAWKPSKDEKSNPDPLVSIITDGRFAAIDPRFFGAELEGESIITKMASNVVAKYHATKDNVYHDKDGNPAPIKGSTQIVFYNLGFGEQSQRSRGFNSRAAFTKLLTDGGIRRDEIAWFDDANTDAKKEAIFKDMRSGKLKVLIGSAKKMGTGVNVQNRLIALHYQDPPWFPADVEQPHGRIIRQGNLNEEVSIDWYTTKGTYQSTMWQMVGRKQRFIDQAFTGDKSLRSMDDMGEASLFEQAAAVASGDPRALQLAGLRQDVERFERLQAAHANEQINIRHALRSAEWEADYETKRISRFSKAFKAIGERYFQFDSGTVDGRTYSKTGEFGQALKDTFNRAARDRLMDMFGGDSVQLATIGSAIKIKMEAQIEKDKPTGSFSMYVEIMGLQLHVVTAPSFGDETDATGLARKVFNQINGIDNSLRTQRANLATHEADIIRLNKKLGAPFEYQQEMAEKYGELKRLEAELRGDGEKVTAPPPEGKKHGQEQDNPIQQAALSGALSGERQLARYDYQDVMARESGALPGESRFNQASSQAASPADRAVYDMAKEGKSAAEILSFIGKASRRPFNRYLANALKNLGASSTITIYSQGGWRFGNTSRAQKYAAAYNSRTDTVALFTAREAERHLLHELVHAATMKAIKAGGPAAVQMRALFMHVQKSGKLDGQYGMSNMDEFVAELFSNPKFQQALKNVAAPKFTGLKSAWQWFVRVAARILGLKTSAQETALDRAMTVGALLMRENAAVMAASEDTRYAIAWHGTPHVWEPEPGFPHGRPRLDKMGTGEGAQSYGWGWYSAEAQDVAKSYQNTLTIDRGFDFDGKSGLTREQVQELVNAREGKRYLDGVSLPSGVADRVIDDIVYGSNDKHLPRQYKPGSERAALYQKLVNEIRHTDNGSLYQLDIPDDVIPKLLEWDKPLSEQTPVVRAALANDFPPPTRRQMELTKLHTASKEREKWTGGIVYSELERKRGGDRAASEYLASLGIPGLRYLDGNSRNNGEGTYNYVIWDQKVLDRIALLERNGEKLDAIRKADESTRFSRSTGRATAEDMKLVREAQRFGAGLSVVPEEMFDHRKNPGIEYGGQFQYAAEHIGDLIHRLSSTEDHGGGVGYGIEAALQKAKRFLQPRNFEDMLPQVDRNFDYWKEKRGYAGSLSDFRKEFDAAADRYADAYKQMPYVTELQKLARRAAINLGLRKFDLVREDLRDLVRVLESENAIEAYWAAAGDIRFSRESKPFDGRDRAKTPIKPGTTTLMVDGTERPALNSEGRPIHWSEEGIRNFWRWFGDSKVVDAQGRPLVLYHGATADFGKGGAPVVFDFGRTADENLSSGKGAYLTTSPEAASKYAKGISWGNGGQADAQNVMPIYARIEAPFSKTAAYRIADFESVLPESVVREAKDSARPSSQFLEETQQAIDEMYYRVQDLQNGDLNDEIAYEYRIDESDYDNEDDYQAAIEESIEREVGDAEREIERYEREIERAWADAEEEYASARMTGSEIWDAIKHDLPEYADWRNERQLIGGDSDSFETDTEVARILYDSFGFDGVKRTDTFPIKSPHTVFIANVAPNQIKSATGNSGDFSPDNQDIRYSIATDWQHSPIASKIGEALSAVKHRDASLSWLNTVQTQYHKAERLAKEGKTGFKGVFDLGQKFLSDISRFAVMAENAAPTLFHQIRSLADAKQAAGAALRGDFGKQNNADIKAIAAPLYEGTLYGGGDPMAGLVWSDDQLKNIYKLTDRQIKLYHEALAAVQVSLDEVAKSLISLHAKREKVLFDSSMTRADMAEDVADSLAIRADWMESESQERHDQQMLAVSDLRKAGRGKEADTLEQEATERLANEQKTVARLRSTIKDVKSISERAGKLQASGYFSLMRFGKHTVTARDEDGNVRHFSRHDGIPLVPRSGQIEATRVAEAIRAEHPDWNVTTGIMNDEAYKLYQGMNIDALQLFADHLDGDMREMYQELLKLKTSDRSAMARLIKRKGTPGFDRDVRRALAAFITSNARFASTNYHSADMAKAAEDAGQDGGDIGSEAVKLYKYLMEPQEEAAKLRGFLFFNYLGGSLAAAMVNATQVPMVAFPTLTQYDGAVKVAARLERSARIAMKDPENVAGELGDALRRAELDGATAPHQMYELTATAANNIFSGSRAASALLRAWGALFALAEAFNRRTTFIAAYEIGQSLSEKQLIDSGSRDAFEFAEKIVKETQGIYNKGNRPNIGRGAIGATIMTFKQFSVMYLELFSRLPPKQKAIMAGMLILAAGFGGLPFAEDVEDIIDTIGQWLGYGTNSRRFVRNALTKAIGGSAADITINGLASRMGINLHSRLGLQNIVPGTALFKPSTTDKGREFQDILGPAASFIFALVQSLQDLATGHPGKAALSVSPVAVQNLVRGAEMASTGYASDMKGRRTVPVSKTESVAKMVGFNPKSVSDYGDIKRDITQDERMLSVRREEFNSAMADAILSGDMEARKEAMRNMAKWNRDNPQLRIYPSMPAITRRVIEARRDGAARVVKAAPKQLRSEAAIEFATQ